jgi:DNA-binding NarL/FixJ family response regulator
VIRILIVDDQELVRAGIKRILNTSDDITVVGEVDDGDGVEAAVAALRPDVVVMDIRMKRVDGVEATTRLLRSDSPPRVIALTTFDDDDTLSRMLRAGAAGFLLKDAPGEDIVRAVEEVARGGAWLDPSVTSRVLSTYCSSAPPVSTTGLDELTPREREVLELLATGASNADIASRLFVGEVTVKTHVSHIFLKLGVRDRAGAIIYAFDSGLVVPRGAQ